MGTTLPLATCLAGVLIEWGSLLLAEGILSSHRNYFLAATTTSFGFDKQPA